MGEDIEFSIRCISLGFTSGLIEDAFIYHKRRTSFKQFYKQLHFFGRARINIGRFFPQELKWVHYFPMAYFLGSIVSIISILIFPKQLIAQLLFFSLTLYNFVIGIDAGLKYKSIKLAYLAIIASNIQLCAYGIGFIGEKFGIISSKK